MKNRNKGFTLAELLIVVAIIAVLVAIAIPVFTSQLEKSREATDLANVRAAYAELLVAVNMEDKSADNITYQGGIYRHTPVALHQTQTGWTTDESKLNIAGIVPGDTAWKGYPRANGTCQVYYIENSQYPIVIDWNGENSITPQTRWQYSNGTITFELGNYADNSGTQVAALRLPVTKKVGDSITLELPDSLKQPNTKYTIGLFYTDVDANGNSYKVYVDSAEKIINDTGVNEYKIDNSVATYQSSNRNGSNIVEGGVNGLNEVGVSIQFFKYVNGSKVDMTQEEANALVNALNY